MLFILHRFTVQVRKVISSPTETVPINPAALRCKQDREPRMTIEDRGVTILTSTQINRAPSKLGATKRSIFTNMQDMFNENILYWFHFNSFLATVTAFRAGSGDWLISPPLWHWNITSDEMDCHDLLCRPSWSLEVEQHWLCWSPFLLAPPWGWHLTFWVKPHSQVLCCQVLSSY